MNYLTHPWIINHNKRQYHALITLYYRPAPQYCLNGGAQTRFRWRFGLFTLELMAGRTAKGGRPPWQPSTARLSGRNSWDFNLCNHGIVRFGRRFLKGQVFRDGVLCLVTLFYCALNVRFILPQFEEKAISAGLERTLQWSEWRVLEIEYNYLA